MKSLDSLLGERYEEATFHDSYLSSFAVDFGRATAAFEFRVPCQATKPDEQVSYQKGTLEFSGVCFYWIEPALLNAQTNDGQPLWITADGPLPDGELEISKTVPEDLPEDAFVHYLYSSATNSFIVIGAKVVLFNWTT